MVTGSARLPWSLHYGSTAPQGTVWEASHADGGPDLLEEEGISEVLRTCKYLNLLPPYCKGLVEKYNLYSSSHDNKELIVLL